MEMLVVSILFSYTRAETRSGGTSRVCTFALKRVENFLDAVHQRGSAENLKQVLSNKFGGYLISSSVHPGESHDEYRSSSLGTQARLDGGFMILGDIAHDGKPQTAAGL